MTGLANGVAGPRSSDTLAADTLAAYRAFLARKATLSSDAGFPCDPSEANLLLKPHQRDMVAWAVRGGRRAIFTAFGLGKTVIQLEIVRLVLTKRALGQRRLRTRAVCCVCGRPWDAPTRPAFRALLARGCLCGGALVEVTDAE